MKRPPRDPAEPLFSRAIIGFSLLLGSSVLAAALGVFLFALYRGRDESEIRVLTFITVVLGDLALVFINRSWSRTTLANLRTPNPALWWLTVATIGVVGLVLYVPVLRDLFRFSTPRFVDLMICPLAATASVSWFEGLKIINRRRHTASLSAFRA